MVGSVNKLNIFNTSFIRPVIKNGLGYRLSYSNDKDTFKTSNTCKTSFSGKSNQTKLRKQILKLKKRILRLEYSVRHPSKIIYTDGFTIATQLQSGKSISEIISKSTFNHFNPKDLDKVVQGATIRQHLLNYMNAQKQITKLKQQINDLEVNHLERSNSTWTEEDESYYAASLLSNCIYNSPLYSRSFRYHNLSLPVQNMVQNNLQSGKKSKFLVVGLGANCEEVYDYAFYSFNTLKKLESKLDDSIDIEMLDYRPKQEFDRDYLDPISIELNQDTRNYLFLPPFIQNNLVKKKCSKSYIYPLEVLEFVADIKENDSKFHHSTPIEKFTANYQGDGYDFLSINNVLQYPGVSSLCADDYRPHRFKFINPFKNLQIESLQIESLHEYKAYRQFLENLLKMVKPGGLISCKVEGYEQTRILNEQLDHIVFFKDEFIKLQDGLYKRNDKIKHL